MAGGKLRQEFIKKIMRIAVDIGHNAPPRDTGAVGVEAEDKLTSEVGKRLIKILLSAGHKVVETCPTSCQSLTGSLRSRVAAANADNADLFISIHFNAANFKAHGCEVYALSRAAAAIAGSILKEICQLGFYNRGVKRAPFYVLKHTAMPAILVECCFCDSAQDMMLYDPITMASAIATGVIGDYKADINENRSLRVVAATWLKKSTEQAQHLPYTKKQFIPEGKYQLLGASPTEEGHNLIKMADGGEWFIFSQHVVIS